MKEEFQREISTRVPGEHGFGGSDKRDQQNKQSKEEQTVWHGVDRAVYFH